METFRTVTGLDMVNSTSKFGTIYEACLKGKETNSPHPRNKKTTHEVLHLINACLTGSIDPPRMNGEKYVQMGVDD